MNLNSTKVVIQDAITIFYFSMDFTFFYSLWSIRLNLNN